MPEKTGDLRADTSDLQITITTGITPKGNTYYEASDQYGNLERSRNPEDAERFVRAKVDVSRTLGLEENYES
ncbi:MAG TPA: hypothetical protein V6D26_09865 [Stenomitos sp.]